LAVRTVALSAAANHAVATLHRLSIAMPFSTLGKAALAGCIIALAILAWAPAEAMTRTPLGGHAEHFVAWLGTAMVLGLTSRRPLPLAAQCLLLTGYAALLEGGQLYAAGRHASFHDFAFSAAGVLLGSTAVWFARRCWLRSASRLARRCHLGQTTASGDAVAVRDPLPRRTIIAAMSEGAPQLR
jgi:VanZ family protein